jgi:hypothetical protein
MTGGIELVMEGESVLGWALAQAAQRHGCRFEAGAHQADPAGARLVCRRDGVTVAAMELQLGEALAVAIVEDALRRIIRSWPCAVPSSAVVLAPAGGVTGPAGAGPVDAVTLGSRWVFTDGGTHCAVRLLTVQQTLCWLVSYSCEMACTGCQGPHDPALDRVPSWIAGDTARVSEYARDRGLGASWRGPLLLGEPAFGPGRRAEALIALTEADYTDHLVGSLLRQAPR